MRFTLTSVAFAAFTGSAFAATCSYDTKEGIAAGYAVTASGVDDIPGICGGLWDNLKQFADCIGVGDASCDGTDGNLSWQFTDGGSCNKGMVEATWYDATKNAYGAIECEED